MGVLYQNGELIYGGERIKRITQYDYDRLSTAEKNNGVIYNIYDADGIQGYNPKGVALTQAEYDALVAAGETESNTMYFITDGTTTTLQSVWDKVGTTPLDSSLPSDCSQAINQLNNDLTALGTPITADWIEGNYSADASNVTGTITLTAGTYIINFVVPVISTSKLFYFYDGSIVPYTYYTASGSYTSKSFIYTCDTTKTCSIKLGQSGAVTISYKERGQFTAIKIA